MTGSLAVLLVEPIGEGVETQAQRQTLVGLGVALGQGYLLWRPVPADE